MQMSIPKNETKEQHLFVKFYDILLKCSGQSNLSDIYEMYIKINDPNQLILPK